MLMTPLCTTQPDLLNVHPRGSHDDTVSCLTFDLSLILDWGRKNHVLFKASKTQFFHLSTYSNFHDVYSFFFDNTKFLILFSLHISLGKIIFPLLLKLPQRSWVYCVDSITISPLCSCCLEYGSLFVVLLDRMKSKAFRLISSHPLTDFGHCFSELFKCMLPPLWKPCSLRHGNRFRSCPV